MSKNITRSKSVMSRFRGRDATSSSASLHVTDDAQAKIIVGREDKRKILERPSTSSGTKKSTASFPKRANTVKRETRDDLFFNPLTAHGKDGPDFCNFPLPSTRPPPSPALPQAVGAPQMVESPLRLYSPESPKTDRTIHQNISEAEIGMALGSPAHPPENWQQAQQSFAVETVNSPHPTDDMSHYADSVVAPKQKKGRKWFGLFGSKKEKTPTAFYQLKPESQQEIPTSDPSSLESKRTGRSRGRSASGKNHQKPDMKRSQTAPPTPGLPNSLQGSPSLSGRTRTPDIRVQGPIGVAVLRSYPRVSPEGPKLDLTLPPVEMERYSVMFGDILQKPSTTTSSLLQRRQATLDRLKSVEDALAEKEAELEARTKAVSKLRATSPQPQHNSPSFSLFPSTPSRQGNRDSSPTRENESLYRSNTSPAGLSPARPSFAPGPDNDVHADIVLHNRTLTTRRGNEHRDSSLSTITKKLHKQSAISSLSSPKSRPQVRTARTWLPNESQLRSPSSEESGNDAPSTNIQAKDDLYSASPLTITRSKFEGNQSTWQMVNSKKQTHGTPSSVSGSTTSETSIVSSSHSTTSFSSVPGGILNLTSMTEQEKVRERGSRKASPTHIQSPRKDKETRIAVKSNHGPRPIISTFNTRTRSTGSASRPILKSPISEQVLKSAPTFSSPRPSLQQSPMTSSSTSSPRKIALPASPHPRPPHTVSSPAPQSQPEPQSSHQKQASTTSITPSLLDLQIDDPDILDVPGRSRTRDPEQKRLESAAGVSIARQISVSRQQRQLLIPIKAGGSKRASGARDRSRSPAVREGGAQNGESEKSEREKERENSSVLAKNLVTGDVVTRKMGSPLEKVTELGLRGGLLSNVKGQSGSDGLGIGVGDSYGGVRVRQGSKLTTPTLVVVPGVDEWASARNGNGNGSANTNTNTDTNANSTGFNSTEEKVEAMMKGSRASSVIESSEWVGKGGKTNLESRAGNRSLRTDVGSGLVYRRSERVEVVDG